jgi:putative modified peptide
MAHDLSTDQIATLLDRLSQDAAFHAAFAKDPASALKSIALPTTLAACMSGRQLASMKAIGDARGAIAALFSDAKTMAQHVHDLAAR